MSAPASEECDRMWWALMTQVSQPPLATASLMTRIGPVSFLSTRTRFPQLSEALGVASRYFLSAFSSSSAMGLKPCAAIINFNSSSSFRCRRMHTHHPNDVEMPMPRTAKSQAFKTASVMKTKTDGAMGPGVKKESVNKGKGTHPAGPGLSWEEKPPAKPVEWLLTHEDKTSHQAQSSHETNGEGMWG